MAEPARLAILLSTFNGEAFLCEQLDSILRQSFTDFIIVARDDGSEDSTSGILARYAAAHAGRFFILPDEGANLGAKASFAALMQYVLEHKSELGLARAYMMFADQDDIWLADKIEIEFNSLLRLEQEGLTGSPHWCIVTLRSLTARGNDWRHPLLRIKACKFSVTV